MKKILFIVSVITCTVFYGCSFETHVAKTPEAVTKELAIAELSNLGQENIGASISDLTVVTSGDTIDPSSIQLKNYKQMIESFIAESSIPDSYDSVHITTNETGIVIQFAAKKLAEALSKGIKADNQDIFQAWKNALASMRHLSQTISQSGLEILKRNCDCSIYLLNGYDDQLVLAYLANGFIQYDIVSAYQPDGYSSMIALTENVDETANDIPDEKSGSDEKMISEYNDYQNILDDYCDKMADALPGLIEEYQSESVSGSGQINELAEIANNKVSELAEICTDGMSQMAAYMYEKNDSYDTYEYWCGKLMDEYEDYAQDIYDAYINDVADQ